MLKTRRKALKSLLSEKVVSIGDYRSLRSGRGLRKVAIVSTDEIMVKNLRSELGVNVELSAFDSRFSFEQSLKQSEWDIALLDERSLRDDTLALCEKIKRQSKLDDLFVVILSTNNSKDLVRQGFEKGCDEWVSRLDDASHLARLLLQQMAV